MSGTLALDTRCPVCGAPPGQACRVAFRGTTHFTRLVRGQRKKKMKERL